MAEQLAKEKARRQARRIDVGALLAATDEQRAAMKTIMDTFGKLPEPLRVIVASQVRKEMET